MGGTKERNEGESTWPGLVILYGLIVLPLTHWLAPDFMPLHMGDIWSFHGADPVHGAAALLPLVVYGITLQTAVSHGRGPIYRRAPVRVPAGKALAYFSLRAAFAAIPEEIAYRWLLFLGGMPLLYFGDQITFGLVQWLNGNLFVPFVDLCSLYLLTDHLHHPETWLVGASVASSNAVFRDGHSYQGWIGWMSSWFTGLYYFGLMFTYGLAFAIAGHFLFNLTVMTVHLLWAKQRIRVVEE